MSPQAMQQVSRGPSAFGEPESPAGERLRAARTAAAALHRWFGVGFTILDGVSGRLICDGEGAIGIDWHSRSELCCQVARGGTPAFLEEEDPLVALAVPLGRGEQVLVAVGLFLTRTVRGVSDLVRAAKVFGVSAETLEIWSKGQKPASPDMLERMALLASAKLAADERIVEMENESEQLAAQISATYEEISLIYQLTHNLRISSSKHDLGRAALQLLAEVLPAEGLAIYLPATDNEAATLLTQGDCPVDADEFALLIDDVKPSAGPVVLNRTATDDPLWRFKKVQQLILVPLAEGERVFGWLAAFNQRQG